jgi:hypothetical protein
MRTILLAASALILISCTTPTMTAMNANTGQQASGMATRDEEPPVPRAFRRPAPTIRGWGSPGAGGMY